MRNRIRNITAVLLSLLILPIVVMMLVSSTVWGSEDVSTDLAAQSVLSAEESIAHCRFGVALGGQNQLPMLDTLGVGWFLNFYFASGSAANGAEFTPVIGVWQNKSAEGVYLEGYDVNPDLTESGLGAQVDNNPGALWIVGNEVDRGPNLDDPDPEHRGQGDTFPDVYAQAFHDVYYFIKDRDPRAKVANSALVQVTPGRLSYLTKVWDEYVALYDEPMPVDVWNMHLYILPEVNIFGQPNGIANVALGTDPALGRRESGGDRNLCPLDEVYCYAEHDDMNVFAEQVVDMRTWMKNHGQQYKPLMITEYSILYPYEPDIGGTCWIQDEYGNCFTKSRVTNLLRNSVDYLSTATDYTLGFPPDNHRLVQQWLWWSVNVKGVGAVSNLYDKEDEVLVLAEPGLAFIEEVQNSPYSVNLFPDQVAFLSATTTSGTVDVDIWTVVRNNGNKNSEAFSVTFYEDAGLTNPIGTVNVPGPSAGNPGLTGCAWREEKVTVTWPGLTPGLHNYWVKVDSGDEIPETPGSGEDDNVAQGFVIVDGNQIFIPATTR